jgi:CubicO group peptidase (beta-lactamase class C family)
MLHRRDLLLGTLLAAPTVKGGKEPLTAAHALLDQAVTGGQLQAAVLHVRARQAIYRRAFGRARTQTVFLLASITKPMTAAAVMSLVQAGKLSLDDPAQKHVPELAGDERARITVRSLLDHTSGLPDMPPDNQELRRRHAPLTDFLASACQAPLLFPPGSAIRYQSMGLLVAGTIVERLTGLPLREHLRRVLFAPLKLTDTSLGLGGRAIADTASCQVPDDPGGWNSPYWRDLGAPWGGAHGTAADVAALLDYFAHPKAPAAGAASDPKAGELVGPETAGAMLTPSLPTGKAPAATNAAPAAAPSGKPTAGNTSTPVVRREHYGLGWRLGLGGKGCSAQTFGHGGATGALAWHDPTRDLTFVLLTTWPSAQSQSALLTPVSEAVAAAFA